MLFNHLNMKSFHLESRKLLSHPICSCCSQDMHGKPAGLYAVYDSVQKRYSQRRYYFPYLHYVCEQCYPVSIPSHIPEWSMMKLTLQPSYSVHHLDLRTKDYILEKKYFDLIHRLCWQRGLPREIMQRILQFFCRSRLQEFAEKVNAEADIWYWEAFVFFFKIDEKLGPGKKLFGG